MNHQKHAWLKTVTGNQAPLFFILGPCSIENETDTLKAAEFLKSLSEKLKFNLIFKVAFDKANRLSLSSFRGHGLDEGLKILSKVKEQFDLPLITDIHESEQAAPVAEVVDVIQIPAMLCRQTDLLLAAGKTGKPVHVKKGQFFAPEDMQGVITKVESTGNENVWLCERGYSFGYKNLVVDYRNFPIMKQYGKPVVFDATHAVQRPGGQGHASGGDRFMVSTLATAAVSLGLAGVFMEVHANPEQALCDGPNMVRHSQLESLVAYLMDLDAWVKGRSAPEVW